MENNKLVVKHVRFSYDDWDWSIDKKKVLAKEVKNVFFEGYVGLINIIKVNTIQSWTWDNEKIVVCNDGMKWFIMAPHNSNYVVTMITDSKMNPVIWYIDLIDKTGIDEDGMFYFEDLFLDILVNINGCIKEDDRDELEQALRQGVITLDQYKKVNDTAESIKKYIACSFEQFKENCLNLTKEIIG